MKRRKFLAALIALPVVGPLVAKAKLLKPEPLDDIIHLKLPHYEAEGGSAIELWSNSPVAGHKPMLLDYSEWLPRSPQDKTRERKRYIRTVYVKRIGKVLYVLRDGTTGLTVHHAITFNFRIAA